MEERSAAGNNIQHASGHQQQRESFDRWCSQPHEYIRVHACMHECMHAHTPALGRIVRRASDTAARQLGDLQTFSAEPLGVCVGAAALLCPCCRLAHYSNEFSPVQVTRAWSVRQHSRCAAVHFSCFADANCCVDGTIPQCLRHLAALHRCMVAVLCDSVQPDSDIVVSAAYDCTVRLWQATMRPACVNLPGRP